MFGRRPDGKRIKNIDPFMRLIPFIMTKRSDSQNYISLDFDCHPLDRFIKDKAGEGITVTYMDIVTAAIVRTIALRPALNRFVMNGRIYARPRIWVALTVHRSLRGKTPETTLKAEFTGHESICEIMEQLNRLITENTQTGGENDTDKLAKTIMSIPTPLIGLTVGAIKFLDKHNALPRSVIEVSPFHTSVFLTNMKSIGLGRIHHHVYDFGTTGLFLAMGKEELRPVASRFGEVEVKKMLPFGFVMDERFCDGLYFSRALKTFGKYLQDPALLENRLEKVEKDVL